MSCGVIYNRVISARDRQMFVNKTGYVWRDESRSGTIFSYVPNVQNFLTMILKQWEVFHNLSVWHIFPFFEELSEKRSLNSLNTNTLHSKYI